MHRVHLKHIFRDIKGREIGMKGFSLIELMIVMVILAIAAMVAVPLVTSASSYQVRSAANILVADMEYARQLAITTGQPHSVVFSTSSEAYQIQDSGGSVIDHPVSIGDTYAVSFPSSELDKVEIQSASFNGTTAVQFDYLGSPYDGSGSALNSGTIILNADSYTETISVEPLTGYVYLQ